MEVVPLEPVVVNVSISHRIAPARPHQTLVHRLPPLSVVMGEGGCENHELRRAIRLLIWFASLDVIVEGLLVEVHLQEKMMNLVGRKWSRFLYPKIVMAIGRTSHVLQCQWFGPRRRATNMVLERCRQVLSKTLAPIVAFGKSWHKHRCQQRRGGRARGATLG
jgi:hypothetical protein